MREWLTSIGLSIVKGENASLFLGYFEYCDYPIVCVLSGVCHFGNILSSGKQRFMVLVLSIDQNSFTFVLLAVSLMEPFLNHNDRVCDNILRCVDTHLVGVAIRKFFCHFVCYNGTRKRVDLGQTVNRRKNLPIHAPTPLL